MLERPIISKDSESFITQLTLSNTHTHVRTRSHTHTHTHTHTHSHTHTLTQTHTHTHTHTHVNHQAIEPARSSVELLGAKVEVKLRKADPLSWATLEQLEK